MSQSLSRAVLYLQRPETLEKMLKLGIRTADLEVPNIFVKSNVVNYQHISFGSYTLSDYSTANGYTQTEIVSTWKTLTLAKDQGNKIFFDAITEDEEVAQKGLISYFQEYINKLQAPAVDAYRFGVITAKAGILAATATLESTTVLAAIEAAFAVVANQGFNTDQDMILYIHPTVLSLLKQATRGYGRFEFGTWGNDPGVSVEKFDGAKVVQVEQSRLGNGVNFILLNKNSAPCFVKYQEAKFFYEIPGYGGRRHQADIGLYHDCFVYDEGVKSVYVHKVATYTVSFDANTGAGTMTALTCNVGSAYPITKNTLTKASNTFTKWNTAANGTGTDYADQALISVTNANIILYAVWTAD